MLSAYDGPPYVERSLEAGARGFVVKDEALSVLMDAIKTVAGGGEFLSPILSRSPEAVSPRTRRRTRMPRREARNRSGQAVFRSRHRTTAT